MKTVPQKILSVRSCGAFSIIEMMVVLAVIVILAALVIPVGRSAIEKSNQAKCLSNLRQIGVALSEYAADNSGDLPPQYWYTHSAAPFSLTSSEGANGLGFLVVGGYLEKNGEGLTGDGRSKVLRCPSKPGAAFFDLNGNGCSYVYENIYSSEYGSPSIDRANKSALLKSSYAIVIDAAQCYGGHPVPHGKVPHAMTGVLYGDGHAQMNPYIDNSAAPFGVRPNQFDTIQMRE